MKPPILLFFSVLLFVNLYSQNNCQQAFNRIKEKYPEANVTIEGKRIADASELVNCSDYKAQQLDSLYLRMEAMPALTQDEIKYLRDGLERINRKYNSNIELDARAMTLLRFHEDRDWDKVLELAEQNARQTYEWQMALDRRSEIRDSMYKNVIDPLLRAAKTDEDRRAIAEKYPDYVRYHDSCPPQKEQ